MANRNLGEAKKAKNDEFYTQYADIQKEVNAYIELDANVFRDKTVLLPCDDPEWSNCPLCALGHDHNQARIYKFVEMEADHVTAWSNGGATDISNCQMLCKTHNRAKGNR